MGKSPRGRIDRMEGINRKRNTMNSASSQNRNATSIQPPAGKTVSKTFFFINISLILFKIFYSVTDI